MSKTLRTAAIVVGVVALAATGVGLAVGATAAAAAGSAGIGALSIATVATTASFAAGALSLAASAAAAAAAKKPGTTTSGNQSRFQTSLDQGLPWAIGRTGTAGIPVHDITYDASGSQNNAYQTFYGVWSADKIHRVVRTLIDKQEVAFALNPVSPSVPDEAVGAYHDFMWLRTQLGAQPEPGGLPATGFAPYPPGWSTAHGLSGKAAFSWTLKFDPKGAAFPGGVIPPKMDELEGAEAWDPRFDSTYPGGSGPQRRDDPTTWGFTENPFLLALKWARGIWQNGRRLMGIGMALAAISVPSAVYAANVADANGWKVGGVVYSTDPKWDVLKKICAAGAGEPMKVGGMLHFYVEAPRVSLATVTTDDIMGKPTVPGGTRTLDRFNGVIPKFRSPDHNWQLVDAKKVTVDAFVAADGRPRTRALTWELVQSAAQVAQLATYEICNSREIDGISLPLRLLWSGYAPGDAITVASSIVAMDSQLVVIRNRTIEPSSAIVTLSVRTETTSKHDFSLGKTTVPPPQPALATADRTGLLQPGISASWPAVADPDGTKPDDNATNSADPNSPLGTTTVGLAEQKRNQLVADTATAMARVQAALQQLDGIQASVNVDIDQLRADLLAAGGQIQSNVTQLATQGAQITAQQLAISNAVGDLATLTTRVAAGAVNLLPNGGLENGLAGWTGAITLRTGAAANGWGRYAAVAPPAGVSVVGTERAACFNGQPYTFSIDIEFLADAGSCRIDIEWFRADGTTLGYSALSTIKSRGAGFSNNQDGRTRVTETAPPDAAFARGRVVWGETPISGVFNLGVRQAKLEQAAQMSAYTGETAVAQTFTAINAQGVEIASLGTTLTTTNATVSQQATAITNLQGEQASFALTLTAQGSSITNLQLATSTLAGQTATITTRLAAGSPNLLRNGGFEAGALGWGGAFGIRPASGASGWGQYAFVTNTGLNVVATDSVVVFPGLTITGSADIEFLVASGIARIDIEWRDEPDTGVVGYSTSDFKPAGQGFARDLAGRLRVTAAAPPGAFKARLRLVTGEGGGIQGLFNIGIRQAKIEAAAQMSPYSTEASVVQSFQALQTLDTQYASLSSTVAVQGVTVSQQQTAIATINGNVTTLFGRAALLVDVGGVISGWETNNNGTTSNFRVYTDAFSIIARDGSGRQFTPFEVLTDGIYMRAKLFADSIETNMLKVNTAVVPAYVQIGVGVQGTGGPGAGGDVIVGGGGGGGGSEP